jgi:PIN domain nuclease of toxin-antitoxin system
MHRLSLQQPVQAWRKSLIDAGLIEVGVSGEIGIQAAQLEGFHGDPADRIITASAISNDAKLCTADQQIIGWMPVSRVVYAGT